MKSEKFTPDNEGCKHSADCELMFNEYINKDLFKMVFVWQGNDQVKLAAPKPGQFFMVKPKRSGVFLTRPLSVAEWRPASDDSDYIRRKTRSKSTPYNRYLTGKYLESDTISFLVAKRGKGTRELASMRSGDEAELIGPLGNAWTDFLPPADDGKPIALIGGGIGIAPLNALLCESPGHTFDFYAGFKSGFKNKDEKFTLLGPAILEAEKIIIATENGKDGQKGLIPDFLDPEKYAAVCACGPEPMLKVVAAKCKAVNVPCYVSLERKMACGVGACMGCTVKTVNGNKSCCSDGPIFNADEVL